ncbi:MAG TPA: outer membrane beta-barrel protein [Steroidobacter sp.]|uniref:outer membrane beta-barrel protein n=1 Tax=Steroidobacter sp. TaxID=1978227 RepID=UPI002ED8428B
MMNKTRWMAGLALGCVLSTPAAFAEEYRGFYFGVWGGSGEFDTASKGTLDGMIVGGLADELASVPIQPDTNLAVDAIYGSDLDDSLTPWGVQVGYRFNKWVAFEVGYVDLGEFLYRLPGELSGGLGVFCDLDFCRDDNGDPTVVTVALDGEFERSIQLTSTGVTASVLGMYPVTPRFDVHVRGGVYYADTRVTNRLRYIDGTGQLGVLQLPEVFNLRHRREDASQTELIAGIGAAWNINEDFSLRVEYQKFFDVGDDDKAGESDVDIINIAVLFK